jgi:hypothetical protein
MCDPTLRQLSKITFIVRNRFPTALPDRYEPHPTPNGGFVNVNMKSIDFVDWLLKYMTSHEASRIITFFENDEDDRAMRALKKFYPQLNY